MLTVATAAITSSGVKVAVGEEVDCMTGSSPVNLALWLWASVEKIAFTASPGGVAGSVMPVGTVVGNVTSGSGTSHSNTSVMLASSIPTGSSPGVSVSSASVVIGSACIGVAAVVGSVAAVYAANVPVESSDVGRGVPLLPYHHPGSDLTTNGTNRIDVGTSMVTMSAPSVSVPLVPNCWDSR